MYRRVKPDDDNVGLTQLANKFSAANIPTIVILGLDPRTHSVNPQHMSYIVYMLASRKNGTIYTGVTNDLSSRIFEHRSGHGSQFTSKYKVKRLVWYEEHELVSSAIQREKNIKQYYRKWKIELIEAMNPEWFDLYRTLGG